MKFPNEQPQKYFNLAYVYCRNTDVAKVQTFLNTYGLFSQALAIINPIVTRFTINASSDIYNSMAVAITLQGVPCILGREVIDGEITLTGVGNLLPPYNFTSVLTSGSITSGFVQNYITNGNATPLVWTCPITSNTVGYTTTWDLQTVIQVTNVSYAFIHSFVNNVGMEFIISCSVDNITYTPLVSITTQNTSGTLDYSYSSSVACIPFRYFKVETKSATSGAGANANTKIYQVIVN